MKENKICEWVIVLCLNFWWIFILTEDIITRSIISFGISGAMAFLLLIIIGKDK